MIVFMCLVLAVTWSAGHAQMGGMAGMSPADYSLLDSAVKQVVHPMASYNSAMVRIAMAMGGPPSNVGEIMQYVPSMTSLARQMGIKPPPSMTLNQMIQQRALQWFYGRQAMSGNQNAGLFGGGGGMFGGNAGGWLMRMMMFDAI